MKAARLLVRALRDPDSVGDCDWSALLTAARAEKLLGSLAFRLGGKPVPAKVEAILEAARRDAAQARTQALWESEMCRRATAHLGVPVVLLKGAAFHAAGLEASVGRSVGDLDILVPRAAIETVEQALIAVGWERLKEDGGYDDLYYRRWMHELPPLIHRERDRMIDVHHTILPLTHRSKPLPGDLIGKSKRLDSGLRILSPEHIVMHAAAHLIADGDLEGGLRNLWDIDRLCREFSGRQSDFFLSLAEEASAHGLYDQTMRALRLCHSLYATPLVEYTEPSKVSFRARWSDRLFLRRLFARDGWGRTARPATRFAFYIRSHWLRMPPLMLARQLWVKARS